jgi:hypothetical protein
MCIERRGDYVEKWCRCSSHSLNKLFLNSFYGFHLTDPHVFGI